MTEVLNFARGLVGTEFPATRVILGLVLLVFAACMVVERTIPLGFKLVPFLPASFSVPTLIQFGALGDLSLRAGDQIIHLPGLGETEPFRLLAAVFVHMGLLHVGMNMLAFTSLGRQLEPHLGSARFVIMFIGSGILGFVASEYWYDRSPPTAGASGGVFGQIGAFVGILYARRHPEWKRELARQLIYAGLLAIAFPVNNAAHLGGLVAGAGFGFAFEKERRNAVLTRGFGVFAVVLLLGSVASVVLSVVSDGTAVLRQVERRHE
jgi:membrane associated rhomboid family serine protease